MQTVSVNDETPRSSQQGDTSGEESVNVSEVREENESNSLASNPNSENENTRSTRQSNEDGLQSVHRRTISGYPALRNVVDNTLYFSQGKPNGSTAKIRVIQQSLCKAMSRTETHFLWIYQYFFWHFLLIGCLEASLFRTFLCFSWLFEITDFT